MPLQPDGNGLELGRFRRDERQLGLRQPAGVGRRAEARGELVPPGDAQPMLVQGARVLVAATQDRDVADAGEVRREEAADYTGADYADALDSVLRSASTPCAASARGSSCQSDPGSSGSEKISRS